MTSRPSGQFSELAGHRMDVRLDQLIPSATGLMAPAPRCGLFSAHPDDRNLLHTLTFSRSLLTVRGTKS